MHIVFQLQSSHFGFIGKVRWTGLADVSSHSEQVHEGYGERRNESCGCTPHAEGYSLVDLFCDQQSQWKNLQSKHSRDH